MSLRARFILPILALAAGCDAGPAPERLPETQADPVEDGTRISFSGQILLDGALAREASGAILVSVRYAGSTQALLRRSYEIDDPWRTGDSIQFGLSEADKLAGDLPKFSRRMSLVVRFDVDGNPATNEPGDVETEALVATGATDLAIVLRRDETSAPRAARAANR